MSFPNLFSHNLQRSGYNQLFINNLTESIMAFTEEGEEFLQFLEAEINRERVFIILTDTGLILVGLYPDKNTFKKILYPEIIHLKQYMGPDNQNEIYLVSQKGTLQIRQCSSLESRRFVRHVKIKLARLKEARRA